jgi:hypothetical protein
LSAAAHIFSAASSTPSSGGIAAARGRFAALWSPASVAVFFFAAIGPPLEAHET